MKRGGTLKLELIKPLNAEWSVVGPRLRALRRGLPLALNLALRDVFTRAVTQIEQVSQGSKRPDTSWQGDVVKRIRFHWTAQLEREAEWASKARKKGKLAKAEDPSLTYAPPGYVLCSETTDYITSAFSGAHFRDLLSGRAGVPTFDGGKAFYAEGRSCSLAGDSDSVELAFPLWGTGAKATRFAVALCGSGHKTLWARLVDAQYERKETIDLIKQAKTGKPATDPQDAADAATLRKRALLELESRKVIKMGRVGIKYDERRRKWFALISWTEYLPTPTGAGVAAACNFGLNRFVAALTETGEIYEDSGGDIIATRTRFQQRRRSMQKHRFHLGRGARGRGVKRRERPITMLGRMESRWVTDRIRRAAADFAAWCVRHRVGIVFFEDLTGLRESFERSTDGSAPEEVKRWIHNWAFYETQNAFQRQLEECGIAVERDKARHVSRRCPRKACGHTAAENVRVLGGDWVKIKGLPSATANLPKNAELKIISGVFYEREQKRSWFQCVECGFKGDGDVIACANHLLDVGRVHALDKMQEGSRKRIQLASGRAKKASARAAE